MTRRTEKINPYKGVTGLKRIGRALSYTCAGLASAYRSEAAFRQEIVLAAVLVPIAAALPATPVHTALLVGAVLLVLIVELLNTAIETVVDRISFDEHELAKRAKDIAAAAVLASFVNCAVIWGLVLYDIFG